MEEMNGIKVGDWVTVKDRNTGRPFKYGYYKVVELLPKGFSIPHPDGGMQGFKCRSLKLHHMTSKKDDKGLTKYRRLIDCKKEKTK